MFQALHKTIIIKPILQEKKRGGLIIIPETKGARQYHSSYYGIVTSISSQSRWLNDLKIGDKIIYIRHEWKKVYDMSFLTNTLNSKQNNPLTKKSERYS